MKVEKLQFPQHLEELQSNGNYWFLKSDILKSLHLTNNAFILASIRQIEQGKLNRLKGEFYTIAPPEYRATGLPAAWFIDAFMKYLDQPYYVGLLTAASLYGAAHQQPMIFQVITNKITRPIQAGNITIQFYYKKVIKDYFYQPRKTPSGAMLISTPEMTAVDLLQYLNASGQINHVATVLAELASQINISSLAKLLEKEDSEVASAQRLGYLLDTVHPDIDLTPLETQLTQKKIINRYLVTGGSKEILEINQRWKIMVNEKIEVDDL